MATKPASTASAALAAQASWLPLVIIVLAQLQMGFNINALPVSIGPISEDLGAPATAISTALLVYSLFVAAFVMLGAKIGKLFGERLIFQVGVLAHGASMAYMAFATDATIMNLAQAVSGIAAAILVPTLVVLIAANYRDRQQAQALGILASIPAVSSAVAFVIAGYIATALSWRYSFALIAFLSAVVFILSFRLKPVPRQPGIKLDFIGVALSAFAIALILIAFNNINEWGLVVAKPGAPFSILDLSPVPFLLVLGVLLGQGFFAWSHRRVAKNKTPLLSLEVLDSRTEKNAVLAFLVAGALSTAVSFLIPIYIQFVQGGTPLFTAVAIVPYTVAVALAAIVTVRFYDRFTPRQLGIVCFALITIGAAFVGFSIFNEWGTPFVILGLMILGVGEGTMLTLLFNVLVSESPKRLAGDVGALRGVANNVSSALGAAFAGVVAVAVLGLVITAGFNQSTLPPALKTEINFNRVDFVSNQQLEQVLSQTSATPAQVAEAVNINEEARLRSLKVTFLLIAGISLLAIFPAAGLPRYAPGSISHEEIIHEEITDYDDSKAASGHGSNEESIHANIE
jgi:MFS family permease